MTTPRRSRAIPIGMAPRQAWYVVAPSDDVDRYLHPVSALGQTIVLFRTSDGSIAALDDCCAHRPYPLSLGRLEGDVVRCGLCGFEFDAAGRCVRVPTQSGIPVDAAVRSFPAREENGRVWVWFGDSGRARMQRIPSLPWLDSDRWATVSGRALVPANYLLLHESFADVTKIPVLAPEIAPAALASTPPPLEVVVTETTVALSREYPPSVLPEWQVKALGCDPNEPFAHRQEGHFDSPAVWVDHWDVQRTDAEPSRLRFAHLVTPLDEYTTRFAWHVSRDFAVDDGDLSDHLVQMFGSYYGRLGAALERAQAILRRDGERREVSVSADIAALKVRAIVRSMLDEEGPPGTRRTRPTD